MTVATTSTRPLLVCALHCVGFLFSTTHALDWEQAPVDSRGFLPRTSFGADSFDNVAYFFGGSQENDEGDNVFGNDLYSLRIIGNDELRFDQLATTADPIPSVRARVGMAATDDYILIVGGSNNLGPSSTPQPASDVSWLYSIADDTWTDVSNGGPSARAGATVVKPYDGGSKFYVHGGVSLLILNDLWEFDTMTLAWRKIMNGSPPGRFNARGFMFGNQAFFYGGFSDAIDQVSSVSIANIGSTTGNIWEVVDDNNSPNLWFPAVTPVVDGKVYVYGGSRPEGTNACGDNVVLPLDPSEDTFLLDTTGDDVVWTPALIRGGAAPLFDGAGVYLDPYFVAVGGLDYQCDPSNPEGSPGVIYQEGQVLRVEVVLVTENPTSSPTRAPTLATGSGAPIDSPSAARTFGTRYILGWMTALPLCVGILLSVGAPCL
jgi:hypothetical protein